MTVTGLPRFEFIDLEVENDVATITLNRPDVRNAMTLEMGQEIIAATAWIAQSDARAVVVTGAGDHFSVGADLKATTSHVTESGRPDLGWVLRQVYNPLVSGLRALPQPVVSAVCGSSVGVSVAIALSAEMVVMAPDAYFLLSFVNIGLIPDGGATALVPARAGYARAAEMMLLGDRVYGEKALEWGLVNEVVPTSDVKPRGAEIANRLAAGPAVAQAAIKRMLGATIGETLAAAMDAEAEAQFVQGEGPEAVEGMTAFLTKRPPDFRSLPRPA